MSIPGSGHPPAKFQGWFSLPELWVKLEPSLDYEFTETVIGANALA